jgi:hypothetical protein
MLTRAVGCRGWPHGRQAAEAILWASCCCRRATAVVKRTSGVAPRPSRLSHRVLAVAFRPSSCTEWQRPLHRYCRAGLWPESTVHRVGVPTAVRVHMQWLWSGRHCRGMALAGARGRQCVAVWCDPQVVADVVWPSQCGGRIAADKI